MPVTRRLHVSAILLAAATVMYGADRPTAIPTIPPAKTLPSIDRLTADLDHNNYFAREQATRQLMAHGRTAIRPMLDTAQRGSLEASSRAVHVLKQIGMSPDLATEDAAYEALSDLAGGKMAVALRATESLRYLKETRQDRSIARIKELGGKATPPYNTTVFPGRRFVGGVGMAKGIVMVGPGGAVLEDEVTTEQVAITIDSEWKGGRDGLRLLGRLNSITQLVLDGPQITDEWLTDLAAAKIQGLTELNLKRTKITSRGLAEITKFQNLAAIDVWYTPITDAQIGELAKLKKLQSVRLYGTRVTAAGADALEKQLQEGKVDRRGGALLGVSGSSAGDGCTINLVTPNSAAAKAGIQTGDLVVDFGGKKVANFVELTAAIADKTGGDRVQVTLQRDGKPLQVTVELGEW